MNVRSELFEGPQPSIRTPHLVLRAVTPADAPRVQAYLSDKAVSDTTLTIPYPYPEGGALEWMSHHAEAWAKGKMATWGICKASDDLVLGAMSLRIVVPHRRAEAGYWVAREAWGGGIATEALRAILAWGFDTLGLHRIEAHHFTENAASGRVMQKCGMKHEGHVRGPVFREGQPRDLELYGMLSADPRL